MRLENCFLEGLNVRINPSTIKGRIQIRLNSIKNGLVPNNMYSFYVKADYFSIDKAPKYLKKDNNILFIYMKYCLDGIRSNLSEANELVVQIKELNDDSYNPIKKQNGIKYDPDAGIKKQRAFKYLILSLYSALDLFSEIVSILFFGISEKLKPGDSKFCDIINIVLKNDKNINPLDPKAGLFKDIQKIITNSINKKGNERNWFILFNLYRNKAAHFGTSISTEIVLHDKNKNFYNFCSKKWPYFIELDFKFKTTSAKSKNDNEFVDFMKKKFIQQDIVTFSNLLYRRIFNLIDNTFEKLTLAYELFKDFEFNQGALDSLNKNSYDNIKFIAFEDE